MKRAFTLVEMLVVIAIISVIAALIVPALASARLSAKRATSVSNLRQCGMVISTYADENGGMNALPTGDAADEMLKAAPTCDPNDYWRNGCKDASVRPLIGSYAYVRHVKPFDTEQGWLDAALIHGNTSKQRTLLISIFYSSKPVPVNTQGFGFLYSSPYPDPILALKEDGSVQVVRISQDYMISSGWSWLFLWQKR